MTDIAILGGRGMLGSEFANFAESEGFSVSILDLPEFDITREKDIKEAVSSSKSIVNCAAFTNVDKAEMEKELCQSINCVAAGKLALAAKLADKHLFHISTDFVFGDNSNTPLDEDFPTCPLSFYGRSKLDGENLIVESGCRNTILRLEWTYGLHGNNFIKKIIELSKNKPLIKVVADQVGAPTHTLEVSRAILCLLKKSATGLFHFSAANFASRFEVAKFINEKLGLNTEIVPCSSEDFPAPAKRPKNSRFNCSKIDSLLDFKRQDWRIQLAKFLDELKKED